MITNSRKAAFNTMLLGILLTSLSYGVFGQIDKIEKPIESAAKTVGKTFGIGNGDHAHIRGNVVQASGNTFTVRDESGAETVVLLTDNTNIEMERKAVLAGDISHDKSALLVGLIVKARGYGNESGQLVAKHVEFHRQNYNAATTVDTRVTPVEKAQDKMAGELVETTGVANNALGEARAAQGSADKAQSSADDAKGAADNANGTAVKAQGTADQARQLAAENRERLMALDDFDAAETLQVKFRVNSAVLTREAKEQLDEFASKANSAKGYVVEISGYTSSEGSNRHNRSLSERRADAVMDYLLDTGKIPPRRIAFPYAGGESNPVADNSTREGRKQNRRSEVKLLVSKGISGTGPVASTPNP